ncbi:MAG: PepSY-like domain-containing protein [Dysgonamonadaceae bacterium]|jgi:hypothetical protein|nr:PepSY-like domain-containing protein [Dysgonamonadaceae bacterium]
MKKSLNISGILLLSAVLLFSCDDDIFTPDRIVTDTFRTMYPNAKYIEWEMKSGYYAAEFIDEGLEKEAWFDKAGSWLLTETEFERNIPEMIRQAVAATEYKDWRIDDVDFIEQNDKESFYVVNLEKGRQERNLYFSESGELMETEVPKWTLSSTF